MIRGCFRSSCAFQVLLYLVITLTSCASQLLLQTVTGQIGAENYTYYRLSRSGTLVLKLESLEGDADLYVSDLSLKPTFEHYEAQSVTCGLDIVEIPYTFERPVGVAVFGHVSYDTSNYKLEIYLISEAEEEASYAHLNEGASDETRSDSGYEKRIPSSHMPKDDDEESPWMSILIGILKVIIDVIL